VLFSVSILFCIPVTSSYSLPYRVQLTLKVLKFKICKTLNCFKLYVFI
jgi:hypothetical protein